MVFKTDRVVRVPPGDLDSARELWRDYSRLPPPNRPVGSATATAAESGQADRAKERDGRYALSGNFHGVVAARHGGRVDLAMPGGAGVGCCGFGGPGTARHSGQGHKHREQRNPPTTRAPRSKSGSTWWRVREALCWTPKWTLSTTWRRSGSGC